MTENTHYKKRNKQYLDSLVRWIKENLLQKGAYGTGQLTIKVQDGMVQDVVSSREHKLIPAVGDEDGKEEKE